jgi:predicted protein tyrosine phosphatase
MTSVHPVKDLWFGYVDTLTLYFDDVKINENNFISPDEANEIISFLKKHHDKAGIVVTCDYGKGRSPAVAAVAAKIYSEPFDINLYPDLNHDIYNYISHNKGLQT